MKAAAPQPDLGPWASPRIRPEQILSEWLSDREGRWTCRQLAAVARAAWPANRRPPSDSSVRRAVESLVSRGVLHVVSTNQRTGDRYAVAPCQAPIDATSHDGGS
jgi:hypothetical protein